MVVEELTFEVPAQKLAAWLHTEEAVWDAFLAAQPGFVRKEVWQLAERPTTVVAVIWWASRAQWHAVSMEEVAARDAEMGELLVGATMRDFEVVRP